MTNCSFLYTCNVLASEKREAMEKKLRIKLEDELKELRAQQQGEEQGAQRRFPQSSETLEELRRKFAEAEERVRIDFLSNKFDTSNKKCIFRSVATSTNYSQIQFINFISYLFNCCC